MIVAPFHFASGGLMAEEVADLAHRDDGPPGILRISEERRSAGLDAVIPPIRRAHKIILGRPQERTGDDPAHAQRVDQFPCRYAHLIQALESEALLVCGNLEDAVGRRVADGQSGTQMRLAQLRDDLGTGGMAVAQNAADTSPLAQLLNQIAGKTRLSARKVSPFESNRHAGDFPVSRLGVLAGRYLRGA